VISITARTGYLWLGMTTLVFSGCASEPTRVAGSADSVRVCTVDGCSMQSRSPEVAASSPVAEPAPAAGVAGAAASGVADAQHDLGLMCLRGDHVPQDGRAAMTWLRRAAEQGQVDAQLALGRLYLSGFETVGPDVAESRRWLTAAAAGGNSEATRLLNQVATIEADNAGLAREQQARRQGQQTDLLGIALAQSLRRSPYRFRPY
jgi:TPR repeat protein